MRFRVVVATYNPPAGRFENCLKMLAAQTHNDFRVCVVDDVSDEPCQELFDKYSKPDWVLIRNEGKRRGAMYNQVAAIREICDDPDDVIVFCDGDDALAHTRVLERLNDIYSQDSAIELTYGSYEPDPPSRTCPPVHAFPNHVIKSRDYRKYSKDTGIVWNHLRTFKYKLFLQMDERDWTDENGEWFLTSPDTAMMTPALELAEKHMYVPEVLYTYTSDNPISEWRARPKEVDKNANYIYTLPKKVRS